MIGRSTNGYRPACARHRNHCTCIITSIVRRPSGIVRRPSGNQTVAGRCICLWEIPLLLPILQSGPVSVRSSAGRQHDERKSTLAADWTVIGVYL
ncbi:hypothetical protein DPMN_113287 [Dreissena polymorpha]|uniref:Uncharacterized protein n=1 Tax=Dreissena polymorpha TaxID=45954 RepID=A0A9D4QRR0_DREPO|nr:hypothetical protein DPMN_113287 [Dreissena polymorpha]